MQAYATTRSSGGHIHGTQRCPSMQRLDTFFVFTFPFFISFFFYVPLVGEGWGQLVFTAIDFQSRYRFLFLYEQVVRMNVLPGQTSHTHMFIGLTFSLSLQLIFLFFSVSVLLPYCPANLANLVLCSILYNTLLYMHLRSQSYSELARVFSILT